jgi:hypothetical protein
VASILDTLSARATERATKDGREVRPLDFIGGLAADHPNEPCLVVVPLQMGESDAATESAAKYRKSLLSELGDRAKILLDDPVILEDAEAVEKVWRACRQVGDRSAKAFPSAQTIRDLLRQEEIAVLYAVQRSVQQAASPIKLSTLEDRESISATIAALDSEALTNMLERFPKRDLVDILVFECRAHKQTRDELTAVKVQAGLITAAEAGWIANEGQAAG